MKLTKFLSYIFPITIFNISPSQVMAQNDAETCNTLTNNNQPIPSNVTCSVSNNNRTATITPSQSILVLKNIENLDNPLGDSFKQENQLGLVEPGTKVKIVGETITPNFMLNYTKIEILQGRLQGQIGWVATGSIILD